MDSSKVMGHGEGPENTLYDKARHESMRLKPIRYGFFRITTEATPPLFCAKCVEEIHGQHVKIGNLLYHEPCFNALP